MKSLGNLALMALLVVNTACRHQAGGDSKVKLIGGESAQFGQFPATVSLPSCTGVKVARASLLTAAHCVLDTNAASLKSSYEVGATLRLRFLDSTGRYVQVERQVADTRVHPAYASRAEQLKGTSPRDGEFSAYPDVALVRLREDLEAVATASLVQQEPRAGAPVVIGGYGCEEEPDSPSEGFGAVTEGMERESSRLKFARIKIHRVQDAHHTFRDVRNVLGDVTLRMCPGDSGGPVYLDDAPAAGAHAFMKVVALNSHRSLGYSAAARIDEGGPFAVGRCLASALKGDLPAIKQGTVPRLCP